MKQRGFTLTELVVVIAIMSVLAAIMTPAFASAKHKANQTVCLSNLRQCGTALLLYEADAGEFPIGQAAINVLSKAPTCDPEDHWRSNCSQPVTLPRVGSYGYVRLCPEFADVSGWRSAMVSENPPSLLISIDYGTLPVAPFQGMDPDFRQCAKDLSCIMPDHLPSFELDGSAKSRWKNIIPKENGSPYLLFDWPTAFTKEQSH